ncbi:L-threonylcarbamoyladenylate synthase [Caldanaerobius fijiensis DSM 17918]|uniref:Threonylcarbamoyl-AMP synthase n=1 Tax=Caldanaerobius fijiensis DSM 17918 TaxID=1121256 RepID=A0A1M4UP81_9THEO|nr:L-threonylcarbamoyladenylate synthase [Caldanaerobius fijiensis]SHE58467.1 L-threonylcarbamoyladenylate synthase [Caldanaerobius fijiensis DSM 17918]
MTKIFRVSKEQPEVDVLREAAKYILNGGIVAFPTETVYGLGANALNPLAVRKIFEAKGRPQDNPLIVHISDIEDVYKYAQKVPDNARTLMDKFWPGPMTLVFKKKNIIPDVITAGLDSVGIRIPSHPVARAFIKECGVPIAAPSANISGKPSPTKAEHVLEDLNGKIDAIIDGGSCDVGVESTVIDVTQSVPMILRPGGITSEQIRDAIGEVAIDPTIKGEVMKEDFRPRAPGMKYKHYSPEAEVYIVKGRIDEVVKKINALAEKDLSEGKKVGIMATAQTHKMYKYGKIVVVGDREDALGIARNLFDVLREFDNAGVDIIYAEAIDEEGLGLAIMNRLVKAAGYKILNL